MVSLESQLEYQTARGAGPYETGMVPDANRTRRSKSCSAAENALSVC